MFWKLCDSKYEIDGESGIKPFTTKLFLIFNLELDLLYINVWQTKTK